MASSHRGHGSSTEETNGRSDNRVKSKDGTRTASASNLNHRQDTEAKRSSTLQAGPSIILPSRNSETDFLRERRPKSRRTVSEHTGGSGTNATKGSDRTSRESTTTNNPWSLQSITATLLGPDSPMTHSRKKASSARSSRSNSTAKQWGPDPNATSATLADEIRSSSRSRKREALLENGISAAKRKGSPPPDESRLIDTHRNEYQDTLAYIHVVKPTDTLAGIVLTYNIDAGALRRANRLWPNDSIQTRSKLLLPVDECLVRGIPAKSPVRPDANSPQIEGPADLLTGVEDHGGKGQWQHHSHVVIEPVGLVEIARLPRHRLSYFPPHQHHQGSVLADVESFAQIEDDPGLGHVFGEIARDSFEGLEQVGSAIETFFRKVSVKAGSWVAKEGGDLIELTQRFTSHNDQDRRSFLGADWSESGSAQASATSSTTSATVSRAVKRTTSTSRRKEQESLI